MKYLGVFEFNFEDLERISEADKKLLNEREKGSDAFPKEEQVLFQLHTLGADLPKKSRDVQCVWIFETDNEDHLINYMMFHAPYADYKFIPLTRSRRVIELWLGGRR